MGAKKTYSVHALVIWVAISLPLFFSLAKKHEKPALTGLVMADERPKLNSETWFNGSYQQETDDYNNDRWGLKELMVRLNNQLYYAWFNQIRVNGFVIGKEDYVFSESYIFSAMGDDVMPEEKVVSLMKKAKLVQDTLHKKGITLLFVYAPGKGKYCIDYVEQKYIHPVKQTNHQLFVKHSKAYGVNQLDLYSWFELLKQKESYPLFPKFGHHWSYYGECLAVDTIIKHIEYLQACKMPRMAWNEIEVVDTARSRDADVLKSMNLWRNPPQNMKLAYPKIYFTGDTMNRTRVLTVSDSYWYGPVYMGVPSYCFAGGQFWYYYNKVVPSPVPGEKVEVWQLDLKESVESNKVLMLLYSDGNLPAFGNGIIEDLYELYTQPDKFYVRIQRRNQIQQYAKQIRENPLLLKKATKWSKEQQITLDSAIRFDAMKMAGILPDKKK